VRRTDSFITFTFQSAKLRRAPVRWNFCRIINYCVQPCRHVAVVFCPLCLSENLKRDGEAEETGLTQRSFTFVGMLQDESRLAD
jgi:hypothetical protein